MARTLAPSAANSYTGSAGNDTGGGYQGNAFPNTGPETPRAAHALKIKVRTVSSGSRGLVIALPARRVSPCPWVVTRATMGHWAVRVSSDPVLNPPCLFLPRCDTSVSSLLLLRDAGSAPLPRLPALVRSPPRLPAPRVQQAAPAPAALGSLAGCSSS